MERYKSVLIIKHTKNKMMKANDDTIAEYINRGFGFVQMIGNPTEAVTLLFKIEGDEKVPYTRKELMQMEKERLKREKVNLKKANKERNQKGKTEKNVELKSNKILEKNTNNSNLLKNNKIFLLLS